MCVCVVVSTSVLFMTVYTSCTRGAVGKEVRDDYVLMSGDIFFLSARSRKIRPNVTAALATSCAVQRPDYLCSDAYSSRQTWLN